MLIQQFQAQTYEKDWTRLNKKIEKQENPGIQESESFLIKHSDQLSKFPDNTTQLYSLLGNSYSLAGDLVKAEENYLLSLQYARKSADSSLKFIVMYSLGVLNYNSNNLLKAEEYYYACMAGMSAIYGQSSREYTAIFSEYTSLLVDLGKYNEAKPYVDALLYYYKTLDGENNQTYLKLLTSKAIIFQNLGDYATATEIFAGMVKNESIIKLGDTLGQVIQTSNLADIYRETGDYDLALYYVKLAKSLYYQYKLDRSRKRPADREVLATIENNLGLCYKAVSDPQKSEMAYNNALAIYREIGKENTEPYCSTLSNKANLYSDLGRYAEASEILWTAIETRKKYFGENSENYANALANLANVFFGSGYYTQALEKNLEANVIYKNTVGENHQAYANNLNSLSLCYLYTKDYAKAEAYKLKALEIIAGTVGRNHYRYAASLISTSELYRAMRQPEKAIQNLKEAVLLVEKNLGNKHELYARARFALAELYAEGQKFEEAGAMYSASLDYYSEQMDSYFNAMSEENQSEFLTNIIPLFQSYDLYLINYRLKAPGKNFSEHLERAFKYQLQLKSLLANRSAQLRKEVAASTDKDLRNLYAEWLSVKNELVNRYKSQEPITDNNDLFKRSSDLEVQLKQKIKSFPRHEQFSLKGFQQKLNPGEAAIEIFRVDERLNDSVGVVKYGALVITKNATVPSFVIFKEGDQLSAQNYEYYSKCIEEQIRDTLSYSTYFGPFVPYLKGIKRIYISSDGIFHKLSFLGLYDTKTKRYLADDYEIYQTSNLASVSKAAAVTPDQNLTATLFGYPDYDYDFKKNKTNVIPEPTQLVAKRFGLTNLAKLPGTKTEVEEIDKQLKAQRWNTSVFMEQFASEENLRKVNNPRVLHIATHGFYLKDVESEDKLFLGFERNAIKGNSMLRSGIILAGAGPATQDSTNLESENDGIMTAEEASLLNLSNTDLVVLSACQTALGDEMGTEGVAGLQRSFTIAGAKNMIMSLWPVDDSATGFLMTEFYKNYALKQDTESAFKVAQAEVRKKYPQPFYWAAFVLLKTFN